MFVILQTGKYTFDKRLSVRSVCKPLLQAVGCTLAFQVLLD